VIRGGSWNNDDAANVRAANRNRNAPSDSNNNVGFRCAKTVVPGLRRASRAALAVA
jgi:formylglycine-generating enzyme required for sulfatase activity